MSNRLKKLQRYHARLAVKNNTKTDGEIMVSKAMWYQCEQCGKRWRMWLEVGLEDHSENHKPVPYLIKCRCGGMARHVDWQDDVEISPPFPITEGVSYFKNSHKSDCGIPVLKGGA